MIKAENGKKAKSRARISPFKDKGKRIRDKTSYLKDEGKGIKDKNDRTDSTPNDTSSSASKG
jgi:hypothetical protein